MSSLVALLGEEVILGKEKKKVKVADLAVEGKSIGFYFSAHWCPPCRGFTPRLIDWYNKIKKTAKADSMEMVFVSSDRDEKSFNEYFGEMPWLALPYEERDKKNKLSSKFQVSGIPTLVFVDHNGKLIERDGRGRIMADPKGEEFPYHPKSLSSILTGNVLKQDKEVDLAEATQGKVLGVYFSAHWCPPCRTFTPQLIKTYQTLQEKGKNFEILFVSQDQDEDAFDDYYKDMPWLAIPFDDKRGKELDKHFEVEGIPTLVLLDEERKVINEDGRAALQADSEGEEFPWKPKPLEKLTGASSGAINKNACLMCLLGGKYEKEEEAKNSMQEVASKYTADMEANPDLPKLSFLYEGNVEGQQDNLADRVVEYLQLQSGDFPKLVVTDIPERVVYIHPSNDISKADVEDIVSRFMAQNLEFSPLKKP